MQIAIHKASNEDIEEVYRMICELEEVVLDKKEFYKIYIRNLTDENVCYLLSIVDEVIVGFISIHIQYLLHHAGKVAEVQDLFIKPTYRNAGIGKILLEEAEKWSLENGAKDIEVSSNRRRKKAHKFYEREKYLKSHFKFTKQL